MSPLLLVFGLFGPFDGLEQARRPQKLEPFWNALPAAVLSGPAQGVVALTVPREGRVRIPGGTFVMGSTPQEMQDAMQLCAKEPLGMRCQNNDRVALALQQLIRAEGHAHQVTLSDYDLDVLEVSVERYRRCVSAGACAAPTFPAGDVRFDQPRFPVTHVTWDDANNFCTWAGERLPTEAEWEYAAHGRQDFVFPWGNTWNPHLANHGSFPADNDADGRDGFLGLAPVGSFPDGATPNGVLDLAGNVQEWVADFYDRDDQAFGYALGAQTNPRNTTYSASGHVLRGGSYLMGAFQLRATSRLARPNGSARDIGFRCAADVGPAAPEEPKKEPPPAPPRGTVISP